MKVTNDFHRYEAARQIYSVLVMHFQEGITQAEIAKLTKLSHAKVNRLIKQGREMGMVEIAIRSPYQALFDLEARFREVTGLETVRITPSASANPETIMHQVGSAAATLLLETLQDGDTICITGGKGVSSVVEALSPERHYEVEVVPATGLVQGKHYTDVNHVATQMADKLGGQAFLVHAPLFADSTAEKRALMKMKSVKDAFDRARKARVAVVGIGSILSGDSSYYDLHPTPARRPQGHRARRRGGRTAGPSHRSRRQAVRLRTQRPARRDEPAGTRRHPRDHRGRGWCQQDRPHLRRPQRASPQSPGARRSDRQRRSRNDEQMTIDHQPASHDSRARSARPASARPPSALAPGPSAAGCGAAPTRPLQSPAFGRRSTQASR